MKHTHDATIEPLQSNLPTELLWAVLSLCPNSTMMQLSKYWCSMFSFSNWKNIANNQPKMLTRYPRHCAQVYYRLMKENDIQTMKTLLATDKQSKQHLWSLLQDSALHFIINDAAPEVLALIKAHININDLDYIKDKSQLGPRDARDHINQFTDIMLYNDSERMKKYLQEYDRALQLEAIEQHQDIIARYASIAILTVLKSILQEDITTSNGILAAVQDSIMAKAAMKKNGYRIDIVEYLLSNGAATDYDEDGESCLAGALSLAHRKNDYRLLELFVRHGLDANPSVNDNQDGMIFIKQPKSKSSSSLPIIFAPRGVAFLPAIMWAVIKQDARLVHTLLIWGADPDIKTDSVNVLTLAEELGNQEIIQALRFAKIKKANVTG